MSLSTQYNSDADDVFLSDFAETVTYTYEDGTTKSISAVFQEFVGALDAFQQGSVTISADATNGISSPKGGETLTRSNGDVWTILDVREAWTGMYDLRVFQPLERV